MIDRPIGRLLLLLLQNERLRRVGIDKAYVLLPVAPGMLDVVLLGLHATGVAGVNVTVSHKRNTFRLGSGPFTRLDVM